MKLHKALLGSAAIVALVATASCKKDQPAVAAAGDTTTTEPVADQGDTPTDSSAVPAAATPTQEPGSGTAKSSEEKAQAALAMIEDMVKIFADNRGNCDATADALSKFLDDNAALIAEGKEWDKDPEFKRLFDEKYKARIEAAMPPMIEAMTECKDNEKLKAAMERLAAN